MTNLSIIILCYNFESYIEQCIRSCITIKSNHKLNVIVIDDCSTDNSLSIINNYTDDCTVLHNPINLGAAASLLRAFEKVTSEFVMRLDGDDFIYPNFIDHRLEILLKDKQCGLIFSDSDRINEKGVTIGSNHVDDKFLLRPVTGFDLLKLYFINAPTVIMRSDALRDCLPIDTAVENIGDWWISLTISQSYTIRYYRSKVAAYRLHASNMHRKISSSTELYDITDHVTLYFAKELNLTKKQFKEVIFSNFVIVGDKYFGSKNTNMAKKSYLRASKSLSFSNKWQLAYLVRLIACYIGLNRYTALKTLFKSAS